MTLQHSLRLAVEGPEYSSPSYANVSIVDASVIASNGKIHLFATNRSIDKPMEIYLDMADRSIISLESGDLLTGPDAKSENSFEKPGQVCSEPFDAVSFQNGKALF